MKNLNILLFLILLSFCFNDDSSDSTNTFDSESYSDEDFSDYHWPEDNSDSTIQNYNLTENEPIPRIILVGFENFKIKQKVIYFNVFFKRIYGNIFPEFLKITLHIINGLLRNLKEEIPTVKCPRISNKGEDNIIFNCTVKTDLDDIIKVSADKNYTLVDKEGNIYDNLQTFLTGYANRTIGNIQNETKEIKSENLIFLQNSTLIMNEPQFYVLGNISENIDIKDNNVILYINENEDGNTKEIPCIIKKNENQLHELECSPRQTVSFNLDNIDGKISNKTLIISMRDNENDFIYIAIPNNDYGKKKSDKGLKPGAIIGIAIVCIAIVILATIVTILLCTKNVKPQSKDIKQVDIYSNVNNSSQQNI